MTALDFPDVERIVSDALRADPAVAAIVGRRVVGKTPADTRQPWVRVTALDDAATDPDTEHLLGVLLQLDCYAGEDGGQPEAAALSRAVRYALRDLPHSEAAGAVVTAVRNQRGARIPDTTEEPARERWIREAVVYIHPVAVG